MFNFNKINIEKFKSHQQLYKRCVDLINNKEKVCQTIIDMTSKDFDCLSKFNLNNDYIYKENDKYDEYYGMWKVGRNPNYYEIN